MNRAERPKFARNKFRREKNQLKREQAEKRQKAYDALTPEQKLAKLDAGGFAAIKERIKIVQESMKDSTRRSCVMQVIEEPLIETPAKEKKGTKARKQAKKDKKGK